MSKSRIIFTVDYAFTIILIICGLIIGEQQSAYAASATTIVSTTPASSLSSLPAFSIAAAADWACNSNTINTVNNIEAKNPKLVLGLGDYYYSDYFNESKSPDCWFKIIKPIEQRVKISVGNHEDDSPSLLNLYMSRFNLTKQYYSFSYQNVHFVAISTELSPKINSEQYNFVREDLEKASSDPNINCIIVYYDKTAYTSPSIGTPIITDAGIHNYTNPQGRIFVIVGTAGAHFFKLLGQTHYMATQFTDIHGFLNIDVKETTLNAKFYSNDGSIKDQFTITKKSIIK